MSQSSRAVGICRADVGATAQSYKFQRVREQIRQAIESGELAGRLPGERALAERFGVNAKTLSKALTDLAAEGLLERSVGRGTYTRGSAPAAQTGRWLILCTPEQARTPLGQHLVHSGRALACAAPGALRPSFLRQFSAVIDLMWQTPADVHRRLIVDGVPVVRVGVEPRGLRTHAVLIDRGHAAFCIGRDMMLMGHRRLAAVESGEEQAISRALELAAKRYAPQTRIQRISANAAGLVGDAVTAFVCDGPETAAAVLRRCDLRDEQVGADVSLAAVGCCDGQPPCSGYWVQPRAVEAAVMDVLREAQPTEPTVLWLVGDWIDCGTVAPVTEEAAGAPHG